MILSSYFLMIIELILRLMIIRLLELLLLKVIIILLIFYGKTKELKILLKMIMKNYIIN
mgnify:CR=1 FL=1